MSSDHQPDPSSHSSGWTPINGHDPKPVRVTWSLTGRVIAVQGQEGPVVQEASTERGTARQNQAGPIIPEASNEPEPSRHGNLIRVSVEPDDPTQQDRWQDSNSPQGSVSTHLVRHVLQVPPSHIKVTITTLKGSWQTDLSTVLRLPLVRHIRNVDTRQDQSTQERIPSSWVSIVLQNAAVPHPRGGPVPTTAGAYAQVGLPKAQFLGPGAYGIFQETSEEDLHVMYVVGPLNSTSRRLISDGYKANIVWPDGRTYVPVGDQLWYSSEEAKYRALLRLYDPLLPPLPRRVGAPNPGADRAAWARKAMGQRVPRVVRALWLDATADSTTEG